MNAVASAVRAEAYRAFQQAVRRGELVRPDSCSRCGEKCIPDGHHADYGRPLDVEWLCRKCHHFAHGFRPLNLYAGDTPPDASEREVHGGIVRVAGDLRFHFATPGSQMAFCGTILGTNARQWGVRQIGLPDDCKRCLKSAGLRPWRAEQRLRKEREE